MIFVLQSAELRAKLDREQQSTMQLTVRNVELQQTVVQVEAALQSESTRSSIEARHLNQQLQRLQNETFESIRHSRNGVLRVVVVVVIEPLAVLLSELCKLNAWLTRCADCADWCCCSEARGPMASSAVDPGVLTRSSYCLCCCYCRCCCYHSCCSSCWCWCYLFPGVAVYMAAALQVYLRMPCCKA